MVVLRKRAGDGADVHLLVVAACWLIRHHTTRGAKRIRFGRTASCVLGWLVLVPLIAAGQGASGRAGAFMRMGVGARAGSLGDAYVAVASGPSAVYWNPAGLSRNEFWQFEASQRRYAFDRNFSFAALTFPIGHRYRLGLGWIGFATDGIEARRDNTPQPDGYIAAGENAFLLSASSRPAEWLGIGTTIKTVTQRLADQSALGYSAGLGVQLYLHERFNLGAAYQDLFSTYRWNTGRRDNFPRVAMAGMAWRLGAGLFSMDYHETAGERGRVRAGVEFASLSSLPIRLGYSRNAFSAGAGLSTTVASHLLRLDYHFATQDGINGRAHAFSIAVDFAATEDHEASLASRRPQRTRSSDTPPGRSTQFSTAQQPVSAAASSPSPRPSRAAWDTGALPFVAKVRVTAEMLNVRRGPGTEYDIVGHLAENDRVRTLRRWGEWYEITLRGKQHGWVSRAGVDER